MSYFVGNCQIHGMYMWSSIPDCPECEKLLNVNPGSGNGQSPTKPPLGTPILSPCCQLPMRALTSRAIHECPCSKEYTDAWLVLNGHVVLQSPVTSTKSKSPTDEENERLIRKVIPAFRGEARCEPPKAPASTPQYPYFNNAEDRNAESFRLVKRHISVAMREWPICRHSREPLELQIEGRPIPGDPYGGEYARPVFYCPTCGVYG